MIAKLQKIGAGKSVVGLVIPAAIRSISTARRSNLTMATLFIAQSHEHADESAAAATLLAVLLLTSKGAAGVTGSGFIVLAATLSSVGTLPVGGPRADTGASIDSCPRRRALTKCDRQRRCNPGTSRNGPANSMMSSQCAKNSAENGCRSRRLSPA